MILISESFVLRIVLYIPLFALEPAAYVSLPRAKKKDNCYATTTGNAMAAMAILCSAVQLVNKAARYAGSVSLVHLLFPLPKLSISSFNC